MLFIALVATLAVATEVEEVAAPPPRAEDLLSSLRQALGTPEAVPVIEYETHSVHWDGAQARDGYGTGAARYGEFTATVTYQASTALHLDMIPRPVYPVQWLWSWTETIVDGKHGFRKGREAFGGPSKGVLTGTRVAVRRKLHTMGAPEVLVGEILSAADLETAWHEGSPALKGEWSGAPMLLVLDAETHLPTELRVTEDVAMFGDAWHTVTYDAWAEVDDLMLPSKLTWSMDGERVQTETRKGHKILSSFDYDVPKSARKSSPNAEDLKHGTHRARFHVDFVNKSFAKDMHTTEHPITPVQMSENTWFINGPLYSVLAVDIGPEIVLVEAPYTPEKSEVTFAFIEKTWPGKTIGTAGLTHGHLDHIGGARAYMARGITLMIPERHAETLSGYASQERTLFSDALSLSPVEPKVVGLPLGKRVIEGTEGRSVEFHVVECDHSREMLLAYVPHEKLLYVSDLYSPGIPPTRGPIGALAMSIINKQLPLAMDFFAQGAHDLSGIVDALNLDVEIVLGGHSAWEGGTMKDVHALRDYHGK